MKKTEMLGTQELMKKQEKIRNISVIAHVDHGKTTLTDSLLGRCGLLAQNKVGDACSTDTMKEERDRGITIKSTSVSLNYDNEYLINLIDCPGHVDFNSEVTASLRVTDGALVVVDCIEGVCVQTETVLRQAMNENIVPILFLNKMDRVFLELDCDNEDIYQKLLKTIESVNTVIQTYHPQNNDTSSSNSDEKNNNNNFDLLVSSGKIGFGSGLHGWGFTLDTFAKIYSEKFGISFDECMKKLWGDYYFDHKNKTFVAFDKNKNKKSKDKRAFNALILSPLRKLISTIMEGKSKEKRYTKMLNDIGVWNKMQSQCKNELSKVGKPKDLVKIALKTWLPAGDTLLDMICKHLPSPLEAQSYRIDSLYGGALDSKECETLRKCDSSSENAGLLFYVSKMVPTNDFSRFIAFGRVFSGTIKTGQEVTVLGSSTGGQGDEEKHNNNNNRRVKIQKCYMMMGNKREIVDCVPAGNVCGLLGLDNYINKSGTIVDFGSKQKGVFNFSPLKTMSFNVSPIVELAINVVKQSDLPKLTEGLRKLNKFDSLVKIKRSETGEMIIAGAGELHLETCVNTLKTLFLKDNCPIKLSEPIVNYNETISDKNTNKGDIYVSKSTNKHNRLYLGVESLYEHKNGEQFINDLENNSLYYVNRVKRKEGLKEICSNNKLATDCLIKDDILHIWTFGCVPGTSSFTNILCDKTKGVQLINEIKNDVINGFESTTMNGVLCHEQIRGVKFNILDCKIHSDKVHRNAGAIIPMTRKCIYASQIGGNIKGKHNNNNNNNNHSGEHCRLMEAIYKCEIICDKRQLNGVYNTLNPRRGCVIDQEAKIGTPLLRIEAQLPVCESFGFTNTLRKNTQGKAFPSLSFSHWSIIDENPYENEKLKNIILSIRERKGMKKELPKFNDYYDKVD